MTTRVLVTVNEVTTCQTLLMLVATITNNDDDSGRGGGGGAVVVVTTMGRIVSKDSMTMLSKTKLTNLFCFINECRSISKLN